MGYVLSVLRSLCTSSHQVKAACRDGQTGKIDEILDALLELCASPQSNQRKGASLLYSSRHGFQFSEQQYWRLRLVLGHGREGCEGPTLSIEKSELIGSHSF